MVREKPLAGWVHGAILNTAFHLAAPRTPPLVFRIEISSRCPSTGFVGALIVKGAPLLTVIECESPAAASMVIDAEYGTPTSGDPVPALNLAFFVG